MRVRPEPAVLRISNDDAVCACAPVPHRLVLRDALPCRHRRVGWQLQTAKQTTCAVSACPCRCAEPSCVHRYGLLPTPRIRTAFRRDRGLSLVSTIAPRKAFRPLKALSRFFVGATVPVTPPFAKLFFENRLVHNKAARRPFPVPRPKTEGVAGSPADLHRDRRRGRHRYARFFLQKVFASAADLFISPPTNPTGFAPTAALGNRLTVDPRTLTPLVLVRIQVPQPLSLLFFNNLATRRQCREYPHTAPPQGRFWRCRTFSGAKPIPSSSGGESPPLSKLVSARQRYTGP